VISLGYGKTELRLDHPLAADAEVFLPPRAAYERKAEDLVTKSLEAPVGSARLREMATGCGSVTIAVPDKTRPNVARQVLPLVLAELAAAGVTASQTRIFIATGIHSGHTGEEMRALIGDDLCQRLRVSQNDGFSAGDFTSLGMTARGTPVEINRDVAGSDLVVAIGGVAFHYFAGFTGGRKMIVPGAASVKTVKSNHRLTLLENGEINPACRSGSLDGNPVHEDMVEAAGLVKSELYLVNVVRDGWGRPADVISGGLVESHVAATAMVRDLFECRLERRCDLAVASAGGYPLDMNLIQAHKSLEHAAASVRDGGVLVAVLACDEGIGSDTFLPWFDCADSREAARNLYARYELNGHTALAFMKKRERINMILVSRLTGEVVERLGVRRADDLDQALAMAQSLVGEHPLVYVFPRAWGLLPVVEE
jgi:nickel-dependent lactate racemase